MIPEAGCDPAGPPTTGIRIDPTVQVWRRRKEIRYAMVVRHNYLLVGRGHADLRIRKYELVSMDFLWFSMQLPLAVLVVVIYIVGMVTGSYLLALMRQLVTGAQRQT